MNISSNKQGKILIIILLPALLAASVWYFTHQNATPIPKNTGPKNVITHTTETPAETPPAKDQYVSTAGPTEPKYITLPTIGAEGFIQNMGVDQYNQIAAPNNVAFAGWYVNSLSPGQPGLSIIDGHVDGTSAPGIFLHLASLSAGDTFTVELGNGTKNLFIVRRVTAVDDAKAAGVLFERDPAIQSQLNLITCGGSFNRQSHSYNQRIIVVSELIKS